MGRPLRPAHPPDHLLTHRRISLEINNRVEPNTHRVWDKCSTVCSARMQEPKVPSAEGQLCYPVAQKERSTVKQQQLAKTSCYPLEDSREKRRPNIHPRPHPFCWVNESGGNITQAESPQKAGDQSENHVPELVVLVQPR